jgi:hypothetical protein
VSVSYIFYISNVDVSVSVSVSCQVSVSESVLHIVATCYIKVRHIKSIPLKKNVELFVVSNYVEDLNINHFIFNSYY